MQDNFLLIMYMIFTILCLMAQTILCKHIEIISENSSGQRPVWECQGKVAAKWRGGLF